jgi:hypothetical protein
MCFKKWKDWGLYIVDALSCAARCIAANLEQCDGSLRHFL